MITLIVAAAVAAQPAPTATAPMQQMPMQKEQHQAMKKDSCDCCKDMESKIKAGTHSPRGAHSRR